MSKEITEKLCDSVQAASLSNDWPPVLLNGEHITFQGGFDLQSWYSKNVVFVAALIGAVVLIAALTDLPLGAEAMGYLVVLATIGASVTYLIYRSQQWIITTHGVYVKGRRPVPFTSIKKINGFGATIRLTGKFGMGASLIGVKDAAHIRNTLLGRA